MRHRIVFSLLSLCICSLRADFEGIVLPLEETPLQSMLEESLLIVDSKPETNYQKDKELYHKVKEHPSLVTDELTDQVFPSQYYVKNGYHITLRGDFIYWKIGLGDFPVLNIVENPTALATQTISYRTYKGMRYDFDPGFRIGVNYTAPRVGWDADFVWTQLHSTSTSQSPSVVSLGGGFYQPQFETLWTDNNVVTIASVASVNSNLSTHLSQLDFTFGRRVNFSQFMTARPHFGIRQVWIDQNFNVNYNITASPAHIQANYLQNQSHRFGFSVGFDMKVDLLWGVGIFADTSYALVYGPNSVVQSGVEIPPQGTAHYYKFRSKKFTNANSIVDIGVGLDWKYSFNAHTYSSSGKEKSALKEVAAIGLKLGYDFHAYLDQAVYFFESTNTGNHQEYYTPTKYNMFLHGITVSAALGF